MRVILQQFLWRQRQDSGFLHPEKTRDFLGTDVLKCGGESGDAGYMGHGGGDVGNHFLYKKT